MISKNVRYRKYELIQCYQLKWIQVHSKFANIYQFFDLKSKENTDFQFWVIFLSTKFYYVTQQTCFLLFEENWITE